MAGIIISGLFVAAFSFLALVIAETNFKVSTDFLMIQNQKDSQDFYTLTKNAQYAGKIISEGVYSELFINEIEKTNKVNAEFLPFDKEEKLKKWSKIVKVNRNPDLGIVSITVFNNNQNQAMAISNAVSEVLITKSNLFFGEGQNIGVKILSGPIIEKNPPVKNIFLISIAGFILGVMFVILRIIFNEEQRIKKVFSMPSAHMNFSAENESENEKNFLSEEEYQERLRCIR